MSEWQPIETAPKDGTAFIVDCRYVEDGVTMMFRNRSGVLVSVLDGKPWKVGLDDPKFWHPLPLPPAP